MAVSAKVQNIIDQLNTLNVLEVAELSKALQEAWGVTAAAPVAMAAAPAAAAAPTDGAAAAPVEEKTEFNVILKEVGPNKIPVIKVIRELTTLGLKEAKDLVAAAPKTVKEAVPKADAETAKSKLEAVGAVVAVE